MDVKIGDKVLSITSKGDIQFSEVMTFLDRNHNRNGLFYTLSTEHNKSLTLTDKHLIYTSRSNTLSIDSYTPKYAEKMQKGEYVLTTDSANNLHPSKVLDIFTSVQTGVVAPLTLDGTIIVDGVVASCYGVVNSETIAHTVFAPYRLFYTMSSYLSIPWQSDSKYDVNSTETFYGINRYAEFLYSVGQYVLTNDMLYKV